ncbi:hypothetical protein NGRA_1388 [Nosema granulosis]|uniref:Uncharacterized protein n=1 Tax=Nosema granulosis TaxID=83296 RepID=A0A9P6GYL0_9MICR|nr:hypothetical protein NGRA_1388 [Nosema granulosis]
MSDETSKTQETAVKEVKEDKKPSEEPSEDKKPVEDKKKSDDPHFDSILTSKIGSLMPDTTEIVDVDDVLSYRDHFEMSDKSHLVPFVIYMDAQFRQVVKTKRRNALLMLLVKILGVCLLVAGLLYGGSLLLQ